MSASADPLRILAHLCRGTLLVAVLCALATCGVWIWRPGWIVSLDRWLVQRYEAGFREPLAAARERLERDPAAGIAGLEELLDDLTEIRKGNRAAPVRRQSFAELTAALLDAGDPERALLRAEQWIAFDPRDLRAHLYRARSLYEVSGRDAGLSAARELFEKLPGSLLVCRLYVTWLLDALDAGREEDAAAAFLAFLRAGGRPGAPPAAGGRPTWRVHWDLGDGFREDRSAPVAALLRDGELSVPFELPAGVRRVRIELPEHARFTLVEPCVALRAGDNEVVRPLFELDFHAHQLITSEGGLAAFGASYSYLDVAVSPLPVRVPIELSASVRRPPGGWVRRVMALPATRRLGEALIAATDPVLAHVAEDYRQIRAAFLEGR